MKKQIILIVLGSILAVGAILSLKFGTIPVLREYNIIIVLFSHKIIVSMVLFYEICFGILIIGIIMLISGLDDISIIKLEKKVKELNKIIEAQEGAIDDLLNINMSINNDYEKIIDKHKASANAYRLNFLKMKKKHEN